jgi:hypothetical protein
MAELVVGDWIETELLINRGRRQKYARRVVTGEIRGISAKKYHIYWHHTETIDGALHEEEGWAEVHKSQSVYQKMAAPESSPPPQIDSE